MYMYFNSINNMNTKLNIRVMLIGTSFKVLMLKINTSNFNNYIVMYFYDKSLHTNTILSRN